MSPVQRLLLALQLSDTCHELQRACFFQALTQSCAVSATENREAGRTADILKAQL